MQTVRKPAAKRANNPVKPAKQVRHAPQERPDPAEAKLRRLTAQVLDELKIPGAIPSNIILDALRKARKM